MKSFGSKAISFLHPRCLSYETHGPDGGGPTPRRVFANAHTYHINSISVNSDYETYMSADDLRVTLYGTLK